MNTKSKLTRSLATLSLTVALSVAAFTFGTPNANAGGCRTGGHYGHYQVRYVQPYKVSTIEVCRHRHFEWRHNHCGHAYQAWYTVVTYQDVYSNGATKNYNVTYWG